jgi:hypothetical protein
MQARRGHEGLSKFFGGNFEIVPAGFNADLAYEAITLADDRLQKLRLHGVIVECHANLADRGIDALLDVHKNIFTPKDVGNLLARDQLALVFDKKHEQLQGKAFDPHELAVAGELEAAEVQLKVAESHFFTGHVRSVFYYLQFLSALFDPVKVPADSSDKLILLQSGSMDLFIVRVQDRITSRGKRRKAGGDI